MNESFKEDQRVLLYDTTQKNSAFSYANWKCSGKTVNESLKSTKFREKPCMQLLQK